LANAIEERLATQCLYNKVKPPIPLWLAAIGCSLLTARVCFVIFVARYYPSRRRIADPSEV